jgi:hypothetical protein
VRFDALGPALLAGLRIQRIDPAILIAEDQRSACAVLTATSAERTAAGLEGPMQTAALGVDAWAPPPALPTNSVPLSTVGAPKAVTSPGKPKAHLELKFSDIGRA